MQQFLARSAIEDVSEVLEIIGQKREILENAYQEIYDRIRFSDLPRSVDRKKLFSLLSHAAEGLITEHFQEHSFQADMVLEEIVQYVDMVQKMVERA